MNSTWRKNALLSVVLSIDPEYGFIVFTAGVSRGEYENQVDPTVRAYTERGGGNLYELSRGALPPRNRDLELQLI